MFAYIRKEREGGGKNGQYMNLTQISSEGISGA